MKKMGASHGEILRIFRDTVHGAFTLVFIIYSLLYILFWTHQNGYFFIISDGLMIIENMTNILLFQKTFFTLLPQVWSRRSLFWRFGYVWIRQHYKTNPHHQGLIHRFRVYDLLGMSLYRLLINKDIKDIENVVSRDKKWNLEFCIEWKK